ncbi:T9SS type A sorting domain-containing protein [Candidatus Nomurabacteria bacterium]|nr:MAG: T9SS type A sorting domain-containing protein [Candidatus Nomurabacteria bacterium]
MKKAFFIALLAFAMPLVISAQTPIQSFVLTEIDDCLYHITVSFEDELYMDETIQFVLKRTSAPASEVFNISDNLPANLQSWSGEVEFFIAIPDGSYKFATKFAGGPVTSTNFTVSGCDIDDDYPNTGSYDYYAYAFEGESGKTEMGFPDVDIDVDEVQPGLARVSVARGNFTEDMEITTSISSEMEAGGALASATFGHLEDVASRAEEQIIYFAFPAGYYKVKTKLEGEINDDTWPEYGEVVLLEDEIFHLNSSLFSNPLLRTDNESEEMETEEEILIFPNPSDGNFHISNISGIKEIRVYSVDGRLVYRSEDQRTDFYIQNTGTYYLNVISEDDSKFCQQIQVIK